MTDVRTQTTRLTAEEIVPGTVHDLGTYEVTEAEVLDFARQWDPQDFHVDRGVAEAGTFGGIIASGVHSTAILQRLCVLAVFNRWQVVAGRRIKGAEFLAPLRPGDTVGGTLTVDDVRLRGGVGAVDLTATLHNQDGVRIYEVRTEVLVRAAG